MSEMQNIEDLSTKTTTRCQNCGTLQQQLDEVKAKNRELEDINEKLTFEVQNLMNSLVSPNQSPGAQSIEIDLKKSIFSQMTQSRDEASSSDDSNTFTGQGVNLKKLQQELRVSKKGEQLAKEKLAQTKKAFDKIEKDFAKYREDSESRIDTLKTEINILQKHYDQLQNSGNDLDSLNGDRASSSQFGFNFGFAQIGASERNNQASSSAGGGVNGQQNQTAELMKVIDDYSRQNELKLKEIEQLSQKLDKKSSKLCDFKKRQADTELKLGRIKSTLDNLKSFLKLFNTNFVRNMKHQNQILKESILSFEKEFSKEIEKMKENSLQQISKLALSKDTNVNSRLISQSQQIQKLEQTLSNIKASHQEDIQNLKQDHQSELNLLNEKHDQKVHKLKLKLSKATEDKTSVNQQQDSVREKLGHQVYELDKKIERLEILLEQEKEKGLLQVKEKEKELSVKNSLIEEMKVKEQALTTRIDDQEQRHRQELDKIIEKATYQQSMHQLQPDPTQFALIIQQTQQKHNEDLRKKTDEFKMAKRTLKKEIETLKKDFEQRMLSQQESINQDKSQLKSEIAGLQNQNSLLINEKEGMDVIKQQLKVDLQGAEQEISRLREQLELCVSRNQQLQTQIEMAEKDRDAFEQEVSQLQQSLAINEKELNLLREQQENLSAPPSMNQQKRSPLQETTLRASGIPETIPEQVNQESQASSSSKSSLYMYEGGQEDNNSEKSAQQRPSLMQGGPPIRPPIHQVRPPGVGRGGSMPAMRPPVRPNMFRPPVTQPRPFSPVTVMQPAFQEKEQVEQKSEENKNEPQITKQHTIEHDENSNKKEIEPVSEKFIPFRQTNISQEQSQRDEPKQFVKEEKVSNNITSANQDDKKEQTEQKEIAKKCEIQEEKKESDPKPLTPAQTTQQNNNASMFDLRNNRFLGMLNGFLTILTRRKTAYTGRPASAMYYDPVKKRYVIEGEEDSDDDVPPPPPPKKLPVQSDQPIQSSQTQPKEEEKKDMNPASVLAQPGFAGALANKNRKPAGRGAPINRFPQTFGAGQISEAAAYRPPVEENKMLPSPRVFEDAPTKQYAPQDTQEITPRNQDEPSQLYTTTMDITLNQTQVFGQVVHQQQYIHEQINETIVEEPSEAYIDARQSLIMDNTTFINAPQIQNQVDQARESEWLVRFNQLQDKINNLKYKNSMLQQELKMERDQNEQTIENFTTLCQDLKFKGMDEVEDLQSDISILKDQLRRLSHDKAVYEVQLLQIRDSHQYYKTENEELRNQVRELKCNIINMEIEKELQHLTEKQGGIQQLSLENQGSNQVEDQSHVNDEEMQALKADIFNYQLDLDNLKWKNTILEAEKLQKSFDAKDIQIQLDKTKHQYAQLEFENHRLSDELKKLQQEHQNFGQELVQRLEREKEQAREMFQRVQNEKERLQAQFLERQNDQETRIKKFESERQRLDLDHARQLREKESVLDQLRNQNISLSQAIQQSQEEIKSLQVQVKELQTKNQTLIAKRQSESEQVQETFKSQLRQVQELLLEKNEQAQQWESKHEEMSIELQQMDAMRHKLTQNIIYLQNEIRKRDDLLENSSEFGDFEMIDGDVDDDSSLLEEASSRGGVAVNEAQSIRGGEERDNTHFNNQEIGGSSNRQSFQVVKKQTTKRKTLHHALQNQLDETRAQLKQRIEEKLQSQRQLQNIEHAFRKLIEGMVDIRKVLDSQHQDLLRMTIEQASSSLMDGEQSSQLFSQPSNEETEKFGQMDPSASLTDAYLSQLHTDETVHQIISKIYDISRGYESELSDLKHKIKMQQMQIEESENLKFDIELLNDEKNMLEDDLTKLTLANGQLEMRINELEKSNQDQRVNFENQMRATVERFESQIHQERINHEQAMENRAVEAQRQIDEIHESFKSQIIPSLKEKHSIKYQKLQERVQEITQELENQLQNERKIVQNLEQENRNLMISNQAKLDEQNEIQDNLRSEVKFAEISNQDLKNQLLNLQTTTDSTISLLKQEVSSLNQELEDQRANSQKEVQKLVSDFESVAQRLNQRYEDKNRKMKEMQTKFQELIVQVQRDEEEKWKQVVEQVRNEQQEASKKNADESEIEVQKNQLSSKVTELQKEIEKLREQNSSLQEQLENMARSAEVQTIDFQTKESQLQEQISQQTSQIDTLQQQIQDLQSQSLNEHIKPQQEEDQSSQIQGLRDQLEVLQIQILAVKTDYDNKCQQKDALIEEKEKILQETIADYTEREQTFKEKTEEYVKKSKEKLKKEQDKTKKVYEELVLMQQEKAKLETTAQELKSKLNDALEKSDKGTSTQIKDLQSIVSQCENDAQKLKDQLDDLESKNQSLNDKIETLNSEIQSKTDQRDQARSQISSLKEQHSTFLHRLYAIYNFEDLALEDSNTLFTKIEEIMTNYEEDKRSLRVMIEEKERFMQLSEQYYQEKESIIIEKEQLQTKLESSSQAKLEKKVRQIEEERNLMKSDYNIQINSFIETIDDLKSRLSKYEPIQEDSKIEEEDAPSFARGKKEVPPTFLDQSKTSHIQQNNTTLQNPDGGQTQRSGIFNSIASFFLTDSELNNPGEKV